MKKIISSGGRRGQSIVALSSLRSRRGTFLSLFVVLSAAAAVLSPVAALAGTFNYGSLMGTDLTFANITETSATDPGPLFGTPTVSANSLTFSPQNFFAVSSLQAPPLDRTDGHLLFDGVSKPGKAINNMFFSEGGARSVGGFGTDATFVDVSAVGFLKVTEVDNVPINVQTFNLNFKFDFGVGGNGTWRLVSEGTDTDIWTGSQLVDINQGLIDRGISFTRGATKVSVNLDNILYAQSEVQGSALIDKKLFFTVTTNTPEPTSCVLALFGLAVGSMFSRRSR